MSILWLSNVGGFEGAGLGDSQAGSVGNGQDGFVLWGLDGGKEGEDFLHGEDLGRGRGLIWDEGGRSTTSGLAQGDSV